MKSTTTIVLALAILLPGSSSVRAQTPPSPITPYGNVVQNVTLAWSDEFDGPALNTDEWFYRTDSRLWSTQLAANVSVANGSLVIALKKEKAGGKNFTGGGIISRRTFQYGYYEARFKVPPGSGWHTSFWTMAYNAKNTAPNGTQEIDICEQDSVKTTKYSAGVIAWDQKGRNYARQYVPTPDLATDFHVWGCEFTPTTVKFFFDGKLTHQADATRFKKGPQNIWLTCISTPYSGTKYVDDSKLPAKAEFDYVRFFAPSLTKVYSN